MSFIFTPSAKLTESDNDSCVGPKVSRWRVGGHMLSEHYCTMADFNGAFKTVLSVIYGYELGLRPGLPAFTPTPVNKGLSAGSMWGQ